MDFFAGIQPPNERSSANDDDLLKHSLNEAITALCTRSKKQQIPSDADYSNGGHVVLFSTFNRYSFPLHLHPSSPLLIPPSSKRIETIERDAQTFHESHNHMALEVTE